MAGDYGSVGNNRHSSHPILRRININSGAGYEEIANEQSEPFRLYKITTFLCWGDLSACLTVGNLMLTIYSVMMVLTGSLQNIYLKGMSTTFLNYPYTLLIFPLVGTAIIFFPITWWRQFVLKKIPPESTGWTAKGLIFAMAICDQLADFLIIYGMAGTSGYLAPIYSQSYIPATMLASYIFLKGRYRILHYVGATIILGGVVFVVLKTTGSDNPPPNTIYGNLLFLSSAIPASVGAVVKQYALSNKKLDLYYLNAWESVFQALLGVALIPLIVMIPNPAAGLPGWDGIPSYFVDSVECIVGVNSMDCGVGNVCDDVCTSIPTPFDNGCVCDCCNLPNAWSWMEITLFVLFDALYNIFVLMIVRNGSAALMFATSALIIPATAVFFQWSWLAGYFQEDLNIWNVLGIVIITAGLIIYRIFPESEIESGTAASVRLSSLGVFFAEEPVPESLSRPRSNRRIRQGYFTKLGIGRPQAPPTSTSSIYEGDWEQVQDFH